jgi:hypothetical protein
LSRLDDGRHVRPATRDQNHNILHPSIVETGSKWGQVLRFAYFLWITTSVFLYL